MVASRIRAPPKSLSLVFLRNSISDSLVINALSEIITSPLLPESREKSARNLAASECFRGPAHSV
jgi:hypothetical protein